MTTENDFSTLQVSDFHLLRPTVAFVLPGGGSFAATQIGMLRALTEAHVHPDFVIGASAGALNAVGFAAQPTLPGIDRLEALWRSLRRHDIAPLSVRDLLRGLRGSRDWLVPDTGLRRVLAEELGIGNFENLALPAHVVVTELESGNPEVISQGDAIQALLASAALPGVYPPVRIAGRTFVDGGISANAPISQAAALGATHTYVLPAAGPSRPETGSRGALDVALRVLNQVLRSAAVIEPGSADPVGSDRSVEVLPTPASSTENFLDFRQSERLILESYHLARAWLNRLQPVAVAA